jgi:hypothetical protein
VEIVLLKEFSGSEDIVVDFVRGDSSFRSASGSARQAAGEPARSLPSDRVGLASACRNYSGWRRRGLYYQHDQPRNFATALFGTLLAAAVPAGGFGSTPSLRHLGYKSPNEKLNIAAIGAGGKGRSDIAGCKAENIVAFADPDDNSAASSYKLYPNVPKYKDFRRMFDKETPNIDAVLVSCPDHMHATAALWAMNRGKHVYCQKPLTRTVWEAQELEKAAARFGVATQMGNQGYSNPGARECCEIIWSGEIGHVTEVHAWTDRPGKYWPQNPDVVPKEAAVPADARLGDLAGRHDPRPYSPRTAPRLAGIPGLRVRSGWRHGVPHHGNTQHGDASWARPPAVECIKKVGPGKYTFPQQTVLRFDFPARQHAPGEGLLARQPEGVPLNSMVFRTANSSATTTTTEPVHR